MLKAIDTIFPNGIQGPLRREAGGYARIGIVAMGWPSAGATCKSKIPGSLAYAGYYLGAYAEGACTFATQGECRDITHRHLRRAWNSMRLDQITWANIKRLLRDEQE